MCRRILWIVLLLALTACSGGRSAGLPADAGAATQAALQPLDSTVPAGPEESGAAGGSHGAVPAVTRQAGVTRPQAGSYTPATAPRLMPGVTSTPTETAIPPTAPPFTLCSPLANVARVDLPRVVSAWYTGPPPGSDARHEGLDFVYYQWRNTGPIAGTTVQALMSGRVAAALDGTFPYGSFVIIETPNAWLPEALKEELKLPDGASLYHLYAHMRDGSLKVKLDDSVEACQAIGVVGKTGNAASAHLHLETRYGPPGASFPVMTYFTDTATVEEKRNYLLWRISKQYLHFDPMRLLGFGIPGWPTPEPHEPKIN